MIGKRGLATGKAPQLFTHSKIPNLELERRITIALICIYSAVDGCMTERHLIHLGQFAQSKGLFTDD